jgi:hypothetical protein
MCSSAPSIFFWLLKFNKNEKQKSLTCCQVSVLMCRVLLILPSELPNHESSNLSPVPVGNNSPAEFTADPVCCLRPRSNLKKSNTEFQDSMKAFVIRIPNHGHCSFLPSPAPPPKLHYTTFWKSLTRRAYYKRKQDIQRLARESCRKQIIAIS